jgi:Ca-activated chloride channel family protein
MTQPTIVFSPLQAGVTAAGGALEVLVRVQAPERPADLAATHLPKRLALVVDRSGSMNGQPLQKALRCVTHIAIQLIQVQLYRGGCNSCFDY